MAIGGSTFEITFDTAPLTKALRRLQDLAEGAELAARALAFLAADEGFYSRLVHASMGPRHRVTLEPSEYFQGVLATIEATWRCAPRGHADPPPAAAGQEGLRPMGDPQ